MLEIIGLVPLPPYINRKPDQRDKDRYQTIFAVHDGSVAAPTAGLHFTENVLVKLRDQKFREQRVTLHVGVGTFRPVACEQIGDHVMHQEKITVTCETIRQLINHSGKPIIAVGTTAARTLESLYWLGQKASMGEVQNPLAVQQWAPYQNNCKAEISTKQALEALLNHLKWHNLDAYSGETQLMIVPGYQFRLISGMVTNFHMPQSTLLLLVAAMIGPKWKDVYQYALDGGYRFLSYGDACLFFTKDNGKNKNQNA
jgi:S-adenosylmethionine:tRNA ribosyltransferase-isomerase